MHGLWRGSLRLQKSIRSTLRGGLYKYNKGKLEAIPFDKGWGKLLGRARKLGGVSPLQLEELQGIVYASLSHEAYSEAAKPLLVSAHSDWDEAADFRQYQVQWLASMLADFRVRGFDPEHLSATDWEELSRIVETFLGLPAGPQRNIIRQLLDVRIRLGEIAKTGKLPPAIHSDVTRDAILQTLSRRGRDAAEGLAYLGCDHWSPLTPLEAYEKDPAEFSRELYRLRRKIAPRRRPVRKSPPASS